MQCSAAHLRTHEILTHRKFNPGGWTGIGLHIISEQLREKAVPHKGRPCHKIFERDDKMIDQTDGRPSPAKGRWRHRAVTFARHSRPLTGFSPGVLSTCIPVRRGGRGRGLGLTGVQLGIATGGNTLVASFLLAPQSQAAVKDPQVRSGLHFDYRRSASQFPPSLLPPPLLPSSPPAAFRSASTAGSQWGASRGPAWGCTIGESPPI